MSINYKHLFWFIALTILSNVAYGQDKNLSYNSPDLEYNSEEELKKKTVLEMKYYSSERPF